MSGSETRTLSLLSQDLDTPRGGPERFAALTILHHPDPERLGERADLRDLDAGAPVSLSRTTLPFRSPAAPEGRPLDHAGVSREPVWIRRQGERLVLSTESQRARARVDGAPLVGERRVSWGELAQRMVLIELGSAVLLWLHQAEGPPPPLSWGGMIGVSPLALALREKVARVGSTPLPCLLLGESGAGKELVARAIHAHSPRRDGPWVAMNMAAVPPSVAAAELFGHAKGAFTGAHAERSGCFFRAHGGTLFLDEIGDTPVDVQPQLLRALDQGEIQPIGRAPQRVDVRLIAATDADLEQAVARGAFRRALLHRLSGVTLRVSALRERPMDIPLLFSHFLQQELARQGAADRLRTPSGERPWLRNALLLHLLSQPFPGNARELRNLAAQVAMFSHDQPHAALAEPLEAPEPAAPDEVEPLTEERVVAAMRANGWSLRATASALGISRNTLVRAIQRSPRLQLPRDLDADTIHDALAAQGSEEAAADALGVSVQGLRLRMSALGLR
ncbi:MAG: sigma-54-dependent Fis family transcriptional regulator [Alphaproteobacteria bacterium]|nr:sigma-54-dependent Fis family transcriptional regulator [Alphaproteobacteria bacterium]